MLESFPLDFFSMHVFNDPSSGLLGVIVIDKNSIYPAIGGTRLSEYHSIIAAIADAIRLAKNMTLKCLLSGVPFSGGKAVFIRPSTIDPNTYFSGYGDIIEGFHGKFITGCDVGVSQDDIMIVRNKTAYVTGLSKNKDIEYLSYLTALGIMEAMKVGLASMQLTVEDAKISIQGVGKVGFWLAKLLKKHGALLTICDLNVERAKKIGEDLGCNVVDSDEIYNLKADIFSPCGLGGVLNKESVSVLNCKVICGAANNQIHEKTILKELDKKNVLFIPDWICNVGGTIYAAHSYLGDDVEFIKNKIFTLVTSSVQDFIKLKQLKSGSNSNALEGYREMIYSRFNFQGAYING